jgi:hypothetical protein
MIIKLDSNDHSELPDLSALDPAVRTLGDRATSLAAQQMLTRILRTPRVAPSPPSKLIGDGSKAGAHLRSAVTRRPTRARRVALVGGMVAATTAGIVVLPALTGGDEAFATWTAAPKGMSAQQQAEAAADCRERQDDGPGEYADEFSSAEAVIAERRGVWTTVVLAGNGGLSAMCVTDSSARLFAEMIGSTGRPTAGDVAPEPRELFATDLGMGTMSAGNISLAAGAAGSDVVSVVYRSRTHGVVTATVNGGHFALWFPGDELKNASSNGMDVDVTYRDGTTATSRLTL